MSAGMQVKLLRVLQERELTRVGGAEVIKIDVRVIAASNKDLKKEMEQKRFREDLFYRLNVVTLNVPPLRERREDVPLLAQHFVQLFAAKNSKSIKGFSPQAMEKLVKYNWPGNVRELMNAVERAVVLSRTKFLDADELSLMMADSPSAGESDKPCMTGSLPLDEVEKRSILEALDTCGGNKSEAARRLGITRKTLRKKLERYEQGGC
jgi:two-component system response regulator HydG